jgi:hypothetical protein
VILLKHFYDIEALRGDLNHRHKKIMLKSSFSCIHVHAIVTRSTNSPSFTPDDILELLQTVNQIYHSTGLQFVCDRETSIESELDPIYNQESSKALWQNRALQHPGKLVLYFTDGDAGAPPPIRNYAYIWQARGFQHARQLAHEIGHYFHLEHTFSDLPLEDVIQQVQQWVLAHPAIQDPAIIPQFVLEEGIDFLNQLLDGDHATVQDTPATLHQFHEAFPNLIHEDSDSTLPIQLQFQGQTHTYHFKPDLKNLMCYAEESDAIHLSSGQIHRIHQALLSDRKALLSVQS